MKGIDKFLFELLLILIGGIVFYSILLLIFPVILFLIKLAVPVIIGIYIYVYIIEHNKIKRGY